VDLMTSRVIPSRYDATYGNLSRHFANPTAHRATASSIGATPTRLPMRLRHSKMRPSCLNGGYAAHSC
jgi:hypothetical protein